ncbi:MAG: anti-sigma factor [Nitrospira sp.]|nr:anti-sigma factor [Nitrospira sp.]
MRTKMQARAPRREHAHAHMGHSRSQCLKILRRLSAYLDNDLSVSVCDEIRKHLGACPNCEVFVNSLRQTVSLCRHMDVAPLAPSFKARLRGEILRAAGHL